MMNSYSVQTDMGQTCPRSRCMRLPGVLLNDRCRLEDRVQRSIEVSDPSNFQGLQQAGFGFWPVA